VLRLQLGAQLRRLREASRISRADAGHVIRASGSKMSRLETGRVGFRDRDMSDLLTLYGVTGEEERSALLELARQANARGWWHDCSDIVPGWFEAYLGLEEAATVIRAYQDQFVHGLLQTEGYARAVTLLGHAGAPAGEVERRVSLRMARQAVLTRQQPPRMWVVLDEAVLRRPVGGTEVMRGQVRHLIEATALPNVTVQVIPFGAGGHAAAGGAFSILRFGAPELPDLVYIEQLTSALYLDKRHSVDHYTEVMDTLCLEAAPAGDSTRAFRAMLKEL